jgi:hypothetical protein
MNSISRVMCVLCTDVIINAAMPMFYDVLQLSLHDPVHCVSLRDYVVSQLGTLRTQVGDSAVTSLMESVDLEISQQLQHFLK